ncbi:MAG: FAD:protein FMN transferase [Candidatus Scalindua sp.]|nr:FAD:protein FMN transferase [Candidatus Scalindua sp.]
MKNKCLVLLLFLTLLFTVSSQCNGQADLKEESSESYDIQVFLTKEQALNQSFPDCDTIVYDEIILTEEEKIRLQKSLKRKIFEDSFIVYFGIKSGKVEGYAIITEEVGKFHPYTFIVSANPEGKIRHIAVLVYRESRGSEIMNKRFLHQFKGKSLKNPIRINRDIINITGATMSVVTMCTGVKKVLAVIEEFYINGKRGKNIDSLNKVEFREKKEKKEATLLKKAVLSMGTVFEITAYVSDNERAEIAFKEVFNEVNRLDKLMSNYKEDSDLSKVNREAGSGAVSCDDELAYIIEQSLMYGDATKGAFDITVGPLMKKWGFFREEGRIPDKKELELALGWVSYKNVIVETETKKSLIRDSRYESVISFENPHTQIDLGGIGKGYAVDVATKMLRENGIRSALINFAGNVYAYGSPAGRKYWAIGLQHPRNSKSILGSFEIVDKAVSTSGDYEKFFIMNGERYSHIIDPRTGTPVKSVVSVTIVADDATMADAFSTGVFVMGVEEGLKFIESKPGVEGIIVYEDSNANLIIKTSSGMRDLFQDDSKQSYKVSKSDIIITGS